MFTYWLNNNCVLLEFQGVYKKLENNRSAQGDKINPFVKALVYRATGF